MDAALLRGTEASAAAACERGGHEEVPGGRPPLPLQLLLGDHYCVDDACLLAWAVTTVHTIKLEGLEGVRTHTHAGLAGEGLRMGEHLAPAVGAVSSAHHPHRDRLHLDDMEGEGSCMYAWKDGSSRWRQTLY